jgi:hypothetical protein
MKNFNLSVFLIIVMLFLGCTGIRYSDQVQEVDIMSSSTKEISSRVLAKAGVWRNSGVYVRKGVAYDISATGRWTAGILCGWTGPDGVGASGLCYNGAVRGWSTSTIIGKVGQNGFPFAIGNDYKLIPRENGILYLKINDPPGLSGDNEGFVSVKISAEQSIIASVTPEEKTYKPSPQKKHQAPYSNISQGQSWAVVIGISEYEHSGRNGLNNLMFADDDAKAFARSLRNLGWNENHIKLLINGEATQRNIMIALESWLTKAGPNDQIILFWAGHGFPDPEDPEKVYFACYDTDISIPVTGYRMDKVRAALEEKKSKNVILLADTCHAGKLITRGERGISIIPQIEKMQREQKIPNGWVFMVAADTDRQAIEHTSWTNGAFTHSLIKGLSGEADGFQSAGAKDGIVTMGELKDYMNISMPDETQKILGIAKRPVITTSTGDPDIWNLTLQIIR